MALFSDFYFISEINHFYDDRSNPGKVGATLGRQEQPSEGSASPPWLTSTNQNRQAKYVENFVNTDAVIALFNL